MGVLPLPDAPGPIAGRRVFTSQGVVFTVADVARLGQVGGRAASGGPTTPGEVEVAVRRSRGLLTADQLGAWLADWMIAPDDFVSWTEDVATGSRTAPTWVEFVCSGAFDAASATLAAAAAAACELGRAPTAAADFDPTGWVERLTAATTTETAVRAAVARQRLAWTRITGSAVTTASRGTGAEVRLCVVADGMGLAEAAALAGCRVVDVDADLDDITPAALRPFLAGAVPGDIMGPVDTPDGWTLVVVSGRSEPDPHDPSVRRRAAALVGADAVRRAVARHLGT